MGDRHAERVGYGDNHGPTLESRGGSGGGDHRHLNDRDDGVDNVAVVVDYDSDDDRSEERLRVRAHWQQFQTPRLIDAPSEKLHFVM